jgi:poly [ADP-ribose] polymerase
MSILQWFKSQKVKKPDRVLPQMTPQKSVGQSTQQFPIGEALDKLRISVVGQSKDVAVSNLHHLCS